jgi:hypothetical protein
MKKNYVSLFIAGLLSLNSFGQTGVTYYPVSPTIGGASVTSNNLAKRSAFVIDNTGNKWIGFNSGLSSSFQLLKYNGAQWDTFPAFNALSATNKINALAVDATNNLWIGSNMGLTVYNGTSFTTYNTSTGLISDTIISLACGNGNVYAGSNRGLSVYNGTGFTNYIIANGMNSNVVNCITVENANAIWLGNQNGIEKFNGSSFTFNYVTANSTADVVNCIYVDAQGNKWIGTNAHGAIKYDNSNFYTFQQLYPLSNQQESLGAGAYPVIVKTICKGPNGGALFCSATSNIPLSAGSGRSYEVTNTQINNYISIAPSSSVTGNQYIMQHDVGSNKIFVVSPAGIAAHVLCSYDPIPVIPVGSGGVITETTGATGNTAFLDINNASALITDNSNLHWDATNSQTKYFVPKQKNTSPLFTSAMWIGGYVNGQIRIAAMTYRQNGIDFWPGPIDPTTATIDTATMSAYNHVWKVNRFDIANFIYFWNAGQVQSGTWTPPAAILNWPGNSPYTGQMLAPYVDFNSDGFYNYRDGDYPLIKGDQMIWSVYNDVANKHTETGSINNIGIEVHASAYAFTCPSIADSNAVLNNSTFYNYQIFNRSTNIIDSTRISLWEDTDLGNYQDDYVGCDVTNDFGYTYNGDNYDEDVVLPGYHSNLPVFACNILRGPLADIGDSIDNNHNCQVDEPGERCMMNGFTYYNNSGDPKDGNPASPNFVSYYNLMASKWKDGSAMTYGNQGLTAGGQACKYLYPGNTDPYGFGLGGTCGSPVTPPISYGATGWTEKAVGNAEGDRRFMVNVGKFTMQPGGMCELDYALVFTQDSINCDTSTTCLLASATKDNQRVKRWFNSNTYPSCLNLSNVGIVKNAAPQLNLSLYPNPANTNVYVEFATEQKNVTIEVFDMLGNLVQGLQYNELGKYAIIPVSVLQSGVYLVKIQSAEGAANKKFIKE